MPPWYYVQPLLLNSLPLSLFVPVAVIMALLKGRRVQLPALAGGPVAVERARLACVAARFFATFWVFTVIFFEFAAFKRRAYLLPLWPCSAFVLARWIIDDVLPQVRAGVGKILYRTIVATCLFLAFINFLFISLRIARMWCAFDLQKFVSAAVRWVRW